MTKDHILSRKREIPEFAKNEDPCRAKKPPQKFQPSELFQSECKGHCEHDGWIDTLVHCGNIASNGIESNNKKYHMYISFISAQVIWMYETVQKIRRNKNFWICLAQHCHAGLSYQKKLSHDIIAFHSNY